MYIHVYNTCSTCWGLNLELEMIQTQVTHSLLYMLYMQSKRIRTYMYMYIYPCIMHLYYILYTCMCTIFLQVGKV